MAHASRTIGIWAKCCRAGVAPSPEFCMPTSMEIVRQSFRPHPSTRAER